MADKDEDVTLSWLELLVLAQYSAPKPPGPNDLAKALLRLALPSKTLAESRSLAQATVSRLEAQGLLAKSSAPRKRSLTMTGSGERALCARLGLTKAPTWTEVRDFHLAALALGLLPGSKQFAIATQTWEGVALLVLQGERRSSASGSTLNEWGDALVLEALGLSAGPVSLDRLRMGALAKAFGVEPKGTFENVIKRLTFKILGNTPTTKAAMLPALTRRWLSGQVDHVVEQSLAVPSPLAFAPTATLPPHSSPATPPSPQLVQPVSETDLLAVVREVIPRVGAEGRFGDEKVFVSAIWRNVERDRRVGDYSLERFKRWLLDANRHGHLALARADLVSAMDAKLVADSEIEDRGATFHFVLDPCSLETPPSARRAHVR